MATTLDSALPSLSAQYADVIACTNALLPGTEGVFAQFVGSRMSLSTKLSSLKEENKKLKSENEALKTNLKVARTSLDDQMQKKVEAEEGLKQYEKQFTIILELLGDNKLNSLSETERRSLAMLKDGRKRTSFSPLSSFVTDCSAVLSPSNASASMDALDGEEEISLLRDGKQWKRRRTPSSEKVMKEISPRSKKMKSNDGKASPPPSPPAPSPPKAQLQAPRMSPQVCLSPVKSLRITKAPPLDSKFKRPPADKKRRRPSKSHLKQMAVMEDDLDERPQDMPAHVDADMVLVEDEEEEEPVPSAPPLSTPSPKLYPILPTESNVLVHSPHEEEPMPTPVATPMASPYVCSRSDCNLQRQHTFFLKTIIKLETINCEVCHKKIKFSKNCYKCRDCRIVCHPDCREKVPLPCIPSVPTPKKKQTSDLASHCPQTIPRVPGLVVHCVNEIKRRGIDTVGIYRVSGSSKTIKEVKERLLRGKGNPGLDKVSDINVICGVLSSFLKSLREPIITFRLHQDFIQAAECEGFAPMFEVVAQLPAPNKDTLAFLILHLQDVASHAHNNKMPAESLAKIFGPTIVGHATPSPSNDVILDDTRKQAKVMEKLLSIRDESSKDGGYWNQFIPGGCAALSPGPGPSPRLALAPATPTPVTPTPGSAMSSPGMRSPATPELRPVPQSPFLGSCQSPKSKSFRRPLMPRPGATKHTTGITTRSKRTGNFFAALD